jgi:hypothetical protein
MKALFAALLLLPAAGLLQISATPCPTEDSTGCYWHGDSRGNTTGQSYLSLTEQIQIQTN